MLKEGRLHYIKILVFASKAIFAVGRAITNADVVDESAVANNDTR